MDPFYGDGEQVSTRGRELMPRQIYNRTAGDVGNILSMEHVHVTVPDQALATFFYVNGLGLTRDPYIDFGPFNVWVNAGRQQFHLPTAPPQVLRGRTGIVVPQLGGLIERLSRVTKRLKDTAFGFKQRKALLRLRWMEWQTRQIRLTSDQEHHSVEKVRADVQAPRKANNPIRYRQSRGGASATDTGQPGTNGKRRTRPGDHVAAAGQSAGRRCR